MRRLLSVRLFFLNHSGAVTIVIVVGVVNLNSRGVLRFDIYSSVCRSCIRLGRFLSTTRFLVTGLSAVTVTSGALTRGSWSGSRGGRSRTRVGIVLVGDGVQSLSVFSKLCEMLTAKSLVCNKQKVLETIDGHETLKFCSSKNATSRLRYN